MANEPNSYESAAKAQFNAECKSALKLYNARKIENRDLESLYRKSGDPVLTELAPIHARLWMDYTFVTNHYRDLLNPLAGFPPPDLQLTVAFSRLCSNHGELAHKHEHFKKNAKGEENEFHKTREIFHREMSHRYREAAKFWEGKTRENREKEIASEIASEITERVSKRFDKLRNDRKKS